MTVARKRGPQLEGVPTPILILLIVVAAMMFAMYLYAPISTAIDSTRREDTGKSTFEKAPTMSELKLMTWQDTESNELNEVQIIKECVQHNLCSKLQSIFGLGRADITEYVKQNPEYCCQAALQKWYVRGSIPQEAYPISWNSVIKVLKELDLQEVSYQLQSALSWRDAQHI